jgi:sugar phosphate isomerase/epimerase
MSLRLAGHTFGYLHQRTLVDAIDDLAAAGFAELELTPTPPHVHLPGPGAYERRGLAHRLRSAGVRCVSVNPGFVDINLISVDPDFRELSLRRIELGTELAHDLGADYHVVVPGRLHGLAPAPEEDARGVLLDGLARLLARADACGVTLVLENSPYGYLGAADDLVAIAEEVDHPRLTLCYDVANALPQEDPAAGVRRLGGRLGLAHISDGWRDRWAHTSAGRGEVDFAAFAAALEDVGYEEVTVYELVDGEDPGPRLEHDLRVLADQGFAVPAREPAS